jgi:hypothetical protein
MGIRTWASCPGTTPGHQKEKEPSMSAVMHKQSATPLRKQQLLLIAIVIVLTLLAITYFSLYTFAHINLIHMLLSDDPYIMVGHP